MKMDRDVYTKSPSVFTAHNAALNPQVYQLYFILFHKIFHSNLKIKQFIFKIKSLNSRIAL